MLKERWWYHVRRNRRASSKFGSYGLSFVVMKTTNISIVIVIFRSAPVQVNAD